MKLKNILILLIPIFSFAQWQPDVRLTNDPSGSYNYAYGNAWSIETNGNNVHVVWHDYRNGNWEIYYKRSTDGGTNWGTDTRLTNNSSQSDNASISVSGSNVHIVWHDFRDGNREIYYKQSTDGGISWGSDTRLTNNASVSQYVSIAVSGSIVHVVWEDDRDGNFEIYYKRSIDGGISWSADVRRTNNTAASNLPSVSISGTSVHIVWEDQRNGNYELYYMGSVDGGITWNTDSRLTNNSAVSQCPSLSVSGNVLHVVWYDDRDGNWEIYYKRSINGGLTWDSDKRLTNNSGISSVPSITVSGSVVHVVWVDDRDGGAFTSEIYYKRSVDAGITWETDTRLTNDMAVSLSPSISVSGSSVNIVWCDARHGDFEIYYKRNPTGNPTSINLIPDGGVIINDDACTLYCDYIPGVNNYKFVIKFDDTTSSDFPVNFIGDSLILYSTNNYLLLSSITLNNFIPAKYYYQAFNDNIPIGNKKVFAKINIDIPAVTSAMPVVLIHGWQSNNSIWDAMKNEIVSLGYSPWAFSYPNTGDIKESAFLLNRAIDYILQRSGSHTQVNILAHSMGGLVTRAYTVNMAKDLLGNTVNYTNNHVKYAAFLATPNRGGIFAYIAELIGIIADNPQIAVGQLVGNSPFMISLNSVALNNSISYLAIGGFDNNFLHYLYSLNNNRGITDDVISSLIRTLGVSDVMVLLNSAIKGPINTFFSQYKIIFRNHANIYKNELFFPISTIKNYLQVFYSNGVIQSDNYATYIFKSVFGKIIDKFTPGQSKLIINDLSGAVVKLYQDNLPDPYVSITDKNGNYSFNYLPTGNYKIIFSSNGYISDSTYFRLSDTLTQAIINKELTVNTSYFGPKNCSVQINSGALFTNNLNVSLNLSAVNATMMMISSDINFTNSSWQTYTNSINYTFTDTSSGIKVIFVKFKNTIESNIVYSTITYNLGFTGQINVNSTPQGARVFINNTPTDFYTPASISNVMYGDYNISVRKSGYSSNPIFIPVTINSNQPYNCNFTFINTPPLPPKSMFLNTNSDTLKIMIEAASDLDLHKTKINYKTDGYPINQNDGINVFNGSTLPDSNYLISIPSLPAMQYYFAAFSMDSSGLFSIPVNKSINIVYIENIGSDIPTSFELYPNYPNPFNPLTTIKFDIIAKVKVKLIIYDILGRELIKLADQEMQPGRYKVDWEANDFPSGAYFYKLEAGDFTDSKKMILIK